MSIILLMILIAESLALNSTEHNTKISKIEVTTLPNALNNKSVPLVRKCCGSEEYFNLTSSRCEVRGNINDFLQKTLDLFEDDTIENIELDTGFLLSCPKMEEKRDSFRDVTNLTHSIDSYGYFMETYYKHEFDHDRYCLENMEMPNGTTYLEVQYCSKVFQKCCWLGTKISPHGCSDIHPDDQPSLYMGQLLRQMRARFGSPERPGCTPHVLFNPYNPEIFYVTSSGHFTFTSKNKEYTTQDYCVDDFIDSTNTTHLYAVVCKEVFPQYLIDNLKSHSLDTLPIGVAGKCCPLGQHIINRNITDKDGGYLMAYDCLDDDRPYNILSDNNVITANITDILYTNLPLCDTGLKYIEYDLSSVGEEVAALLDHKQNFITVNPYGKCIKYASYFNRTNYCLDYRINGSHIKSIGIICEKNWNLHDLRRDTIFPTLMATTLGMSCAALMATAVLIVTSKVRRGSVTLHRMKTIAGKLQLSYVSTSFIGFLALAVGHRADIRNNEDSIGCLVLGGILIYFNLAAFHWNTSICIEPLLMVMNVRVSEGRRYLFHSLWAWGVPGIYTIFAFTLDALRYRGIIPCTTITPEIGFIRCFISDNRAEFFYYYLPMLTTLLANIGFLVALPAVRNRNLKKFPHAPSNNATGNVETKQKGATQNQGKKSYGVRKHHNNNVSKEALKMGMWSGATLLLEVVSYFVFQIEAITGGSWYDNHDYIWYITSCFNSLRGLGIFFIEFARAYDAFKLKKTKKGINYQRKAPTAKKAHDSGLGSSATGNNVGRTSLPTIDSDISSKGLGTASSESDQGVDTGENRRHPSSTVRIPRAPMERVNSRTSKTKL